MSRCYLQLLYTDVMHLGLMGIGIYMGGLTASRVSHTPKQQASTGHAPESGAEPIVRLRSGMRALKVKIQWKFTKALQSGMNSERRHRGDMSGQHTGKKKLFFDFRTTDPGAQ